MAKKETERDGAAGKDSEPPAGDTENKAEAAGADSASADDEKEAAGAGEKEPDAAPPEDEPAGSVDPVKAVKDVTARDEAAPHAAAAKSAPPAKKGAPWGAPFARFEAAWTRFETKLI